MYQKQSSTVSVTFSYHRIVIIILQLITRNSLTIASFFSILFRENWPLKKMESVSFLECGESFCSPTKMFSRKSCFRANLPRRSHVNSETISRCIIVYWDLTGRHSRHSVATIAQC